jgi:hypothetical protein
MAGSWRHMTTKTGQLRNNADFCSMIENLGDAYETAEECYGMIWWLAGMLVDLTGPSGVTYPPDRNLALENIR